MKMFSLLAVTLFRNIVIKYIDNAVETDILLQRLIAKAELRYVYLILIK